MTKKIESAVSLPKGCDFRVIRNGSMGNSGLRRKVLVLDIDFTTVNSRAVGEAEARERQALALSNDLPADFFNDARRDFKERDFDLANMAEAIVLRALTNPETDSAVRQTLEGLSPRQVLEKFTRPHHQAILEVEKSVCGAAYPGVAAALEVLRVMHPDAIIVAHTDCPAWLGLLRLHNADLLQYFDGIMGCATLEPLWLKQSMYFSCADESHRWTEGVIRRLLGLYPNIRVVVAAQTAICKPSHIGLQALLSSLHVSENAVLFHIDDKPIGAAVVAGLRNSGGIAGAQCMHAQYGYGKPADWSGVDWSLKRFLDAFVVIQANFAAVDR